MEKPRNTSHDAGNWKARISAENLLKVYCARGALDYQSSWCVATCPAGAVITEKFTIADLYLKGSQFPSYTGMSRLNESLCFRMASLSITSVSTNYLDLMGA